MQAKQPLRVHFLSPADAGHLDFLYTQLDPRIELTVGETIPEPPNYEILVAGRPPRQFLEASSQLRTLLIPFAGVPAGTRELLVDMPQVAVYNLHHNAPATAEMALALLLATAKFLLPMDQALRQGDWRPRYAHRPSLLLQGKTALILGYGSIGSYLGRVLQALEMRVLGIRRRAAVATDGIAELHGLEALPELLPQAQVLLVALPLTPETEGLLDAESLAQLPRGAILVNVGRGPVIDQAALFAALVSGQLRGAGLDVWYNYPPDVAARSQTMPADLPFHTLENVVMSPHRASAVDDGEQIRMQALAQVLNGLLRGEPMPGRVDLAAGY